MRAILKKAALGATEAIKWGVPTLAHKYVLFAYDAFKTHVSLMPTPPVVKVFTKELKGYATSKSVIKFSFDTPLPTALILKIAKYRVKVSKEKDMRWM